MTLSEIFDKLLEQRKIALVLDRTAADSLRVSLIRKFNEYKKQTASFGWLSEDLETAVVSLEWAPDPLVATYYLRPRKRRAVEYTLLETPHVPDSRS